jgi:hypothetical protein
MNLVHSAFTLSVWALELMRFPTFAMIAALAAVFVIRTGQQRSSAPRPLHRWSILSHLLFFPAAIAVGVLFPAFTLNGRPLSPNHFGQLAVSILTYASFASCLFWIWKMRGFRWLAVGLVTLLEVPVLTALLVAGMSVTGNWM